MKNYKLTKFTQKIMVSIAFIMLFNFISPVFMLVSKAAKMTDPPDSGTTAPYYIDKNGNRVYLSQTDENGAWKIEDDSLIGTGAEVWVFHVGVDSSEDQSESGETPNTQSTDHSSETMTSTTTAEENAKTVEEEDGQDDDSSASGKITDAGSFFAETGGILLSPFVAFTNFIADTIVTALQGFMTGNWNMVMYGKNAKNNEAMITQKSYKSAKAQYEIEDDFGLGDGVTLRFPNFKYSCEEIFANKVPMLDVNFLNPSVDSSDNVGGNNIAEVLQGIIKAWYRVLRMIAIVGLLSVLIYTGIRIMIDSNVENKAKYKQRLIDWVVAILILFTMHYIMSFTLAMTEELTDLFTGDSEDTWTIAAHYSTKDLYFKTNLIGLARFQVQNDNLFAKLTFEVVYIALIAFTVKFTIVYLKRVLHMAFLTMISPIVALTYPIDKMNDGKAQGFTLWLREYVFNALLQPMHYLLYTMLVSSSLTLAASNPIYAIVALFFISHAEKFLKQLFGFGKASGGMVAGMDSFATGALTGALVSNIKKGGAMLKGNGPDGNTKSRLPRMKKDTGIDNLPGADAATAALAGGNDQGGASNIIEQQDSQGMFGSQTQEEQKQQSIFGNDQNAGGILVGPDGKPLVNLDAGPQQETIGQEEQPPVMPAQAESMNLANSLGSANTLPKPNRKEGARRLGRRLVRPFWDPDRSAKYNIKRWGRRYLQGGVATMAAAAEMGASITDGKYNPGEALASAYVGGRLAGKAYNGTGNTVDSMIQEARAGTYGTDAALADRYKKDWDNSAETRKFYNDNYSTLQEANEKRELARDELLTRGIDDFKDQKKALKYADDIYEDKRAEWEENERAVIAQQHQDYSQAQNDKAMEERKQSQRIQKSILNA